MNKKFLLVAALCAAMNLSSFAQDNLALNKNVTVSSGTVAEPGTNAVDGDLNSRWQIDAGNEIETVDADNDYTVTSGHWIYVDLGEKQEFNTIRVRWESAYAKAFKILVADELDENTNEPKWKDEAVFEKEEALTDFSKYYTYDLGTTINARYVKLQATKLGYPGNWFSLYEMGVYNVSADEKTPVITSMTASKSFVALDEAFTVNVVDQFGNAMTEGLTYDLTNATQQADGTFKANGAGEIVIKATDKQGNTKTVKAYAVTEAPATPTLGADDMPIFIDNTDGLETYNKGWEGGYANNEILDFNGKKVYAVTNVATFGWLKNAIADTDYANLEFDIYSTKDLNNVYVQYENAGIDDKHFDVKAGEWTHVSLDVEGATAYNKYIKFKLGAGGSDSNPDILLANVYLKKAAASQGVVIGTKADANGFVSVKGEITTADLATLAETDGTAFDLTKATLGEGVTSVAFKNPNAMIQVEGTKGADGIGVPATDWGETKNIVVKADGYYFPAKQLEITDKYAVFRSFFISGAVGYKYTRALAAKTYSTVYLNNGAAVPAGCKVYEFAVDEADANKVVLKETAAINALTPYIVYNGNDEAAELVSETTGGDINFQAADNAKTVGNLNAIGTFDYFTGNDKDVTVYGIQKENGADGKLTLKKVTTAAVCPFRVYFTVAGNDEAAAKAITFDIEGTATGIKDIHAVDAAKAGNVYSIDGKLVKANAATTEGLAKGVYVINGKKYVIK